MKKIIYLVMLMFIHFFSIGAFFALLDSYRPYGKSGNIMSTLLAFIITMTSCLILFIIILIEKYFNIRFKNIIISFLCLHCIFHFCWEAFFEYNLFKDSKSFSISSIVIILIYFIFELFLTFYMVNRLYKSKDH